MAATTALATEVVSVCELTAGDFLLLGDATGAVLDASLVGGQVVVRYNETNGPVRNWTVALTQTVKRLA